MRFKLVNLVSYHYTNIQNCQRPTSDSITMNLLTLLLIVVPAVSSQRPNIVFILADDLGWNDVAFHGSGQIPTPNIDALAYSGIILDKYYVPPICTPSRSALMTGKYPIHNGMQHTVLYGAEPRGLSLNEKLLPQYLEELGYANHIVGKWHLGFFKKEYTPTFRGFRTHTGFWTGRHDYYDHMSQEGHYSGHDMRRGMKPAWDLQGQYSTDIFTKNAVSVIKAHNESEPLFLYLAHAAVHSGNAYRPLPAPEEVVDKFDSIDDPKRRRFAAMVSIMDDSVGHVVEALRERKMLANSIIVFASDNGGAAAGFNLNAASNFPLRGVKNTLWDGGVRGAGLLWSPLLNNPGRVSRQLFHVTDWLPTLIAAAGGDPSLLNIDGMNLWPALSNDTESPRTSILHNIDDQYGNSAITVDDWKLLQGTTYGGEWDSWYGPSGRKVPYNISEVFASQTYRAVATLGINVSTEKALSLRQNATVECAPRNATLSACQLLKAPCLFKIYEDPCEYNNLANVYPDIVTWLKNETRKWNATAVLPANVPLDPHGDPKLWNGTWNDFGDYNSTVSSSHSPTSYFIVIYLLSLTVPCCTIKLLL